MGEVLDKAKQLQDRTKQFALRVLRLFQSLPHDPAAQILGRQLLRAATSVAANYRAACRSRSQAEFAAKLGTVVEEADETAFWLELLIESKIMPENKVSRLLQESTELLSIFSASRRTTRQHHNK